MIFLPWSRLEISLHPIVELHFLDVSELNLWTDSLLELDFAGARNS
jgi:hypothetical protein